MAENDMHYNGTPDTEADQTDMDRRAENAENSFSGNQMTPMPDMNENDSARWYNPITPTFPTFPVQPAFPSWPSFPGTPSQAYSQVRFLNASTNGFTVNIFIDNMTYAQNSRFATISNYGPVADGFHTVTVRRATGMRSILLQQTFPFVSGQKVTMVLTDSASGDLEIIRIVDTGCRNLPANSGCFRFANMTYSGTRFDLMLANGATVFRNINFQSVSSYKQAAAGSYLFYVTNSNSYTFLRELPVIVVGVIAGSSGIRQPVISFSANIAAGRNYTAYIIGNNWSNSNLQVLTVED